MPRPLLNEARDRLDRAFEDVRDATQRESRPARSLRPWVDPGPRMSASGTKPK